MATLTDPQARVLDFLFRCGWASPRTIANVLWSNRRKSAQASALMERMQARGLAERYLGTAWTLTDAGKTLWRERQPEVAS